MITDVRKQTTLEFKSTLERLHDASEKVLGFFGGLGLSKSDLFDVRLCFEESLINAVKYGNKHDKNLPVRVELAYNDCELFIAVEDSGRGFNHNGLPDPTKGQNLEAASGRGIFLIKHLMDRVRYNDKGNRIEMVKAYQKPKEERG